MKWLNHCWMWSIASSVFAYANGCHIFFIQNGWCYVWSLWQAAITSSWIAMHSQSMLELPEIPAWRNGKVHLSRCQLWQAIRNKLWTCTVEDKAVCKLSNDYYLNDVLRILATLLMNIVTIRLLNRRLNYVIAIWAAQLCTIFHQMVEVDNIVWVTSLFHFWAADAIA